MATSIHDAVHDAYEIDPDAFPSWNVYNTVVAWSTDTVERELDA